MDAWLQTAMAAVVGALVTAVVYLFKENQNLAESESQCRERLASMRAEIISLNAIVEQMQWSGANRLEAVIVADMSAGTVIEWNPGATILLHWTEREMLGKSISKIIPQRYRDTHDEAIRKLVKGSESPKRGPILGHALTKDGVEIPVEIMLSGWRNGSCPIMAASIRRRIDGVTGDSYVANPASR